MIHPFFSKDAYRQFWAEFHDQFFSSLNLVFNFFVKYLAAFYFCLFSFPLFLQLCLVLLREFSHIYDSALLRLNVHDLLHNSRYRLVYKCIWFMHFCIATIFCAITSVVKSTMSSLTDVFFSFIYVP